MINSDKRKKNMSDFYIIIVIILSVCYFTVMIILFKSEPDRKLLLNV